MGCDRGERNAALPGLFGENVAFERPPAAAGIERRIMRLAKQHREITRAFIPQGLDRGIERDAGIAAAATICAGCNPADAAGAHLSPIPVHLPPKDPDMADQT